MYGLRGIIIEVGLQKVEGDGAALRVQRTPLQSEWQRKNLQITLNCPEEKQPQCYFIFKSRPSIVSVRNVLTLAVAAIIANTMVSRISSSDAPAFFAPAKWVSVQ